jgi:hypothetical protein
MSGEPTRITERDRLALHGGVEVIRIYQRMIEETTTIIARILQVEPDPGYGAANYYGVLSDEVIDDRQSGNVTVDKLLRHYEVEVTPDVSEDHVQRQEREAEGLGHE